MNDHQLWQALRAGQEDALERIYRAHIDALLAYGQKFTRDAGLVEDCIHDLFVDLWKNRQGLGSNDSIRPYLLVALRRRIVKTQQRRAKREGGVLPEEAAFAAELAIDEQIIDRETGKEQAHQLKTAFAQLSERQREALYLKYFEGLDYEAICEVMDIRYQSARNLVFAGLRALRNYLTLLLCWLFL